ncbi:hypothetical protein [Rodentibacter ratti]|uniref:hypothetical protein n=1 Tax=Rodentibacter ratti TaxID=1906745 RepID=UPI001300EE25|nr:hypothetical protein [Rodentibacter ratti]
MRLKIAVFSFCIKDAEIGKSTDELSPIAILALGGSLKRYSVSTMTVQSVCPSR